MARTVSIIGSFRKPDHYQIIKKAVLSFQKEGLIVLSPKGSSIRKSVDKFVIFDSDDQDLIPWEIQMITLDKIIHSDVVYVCNVNGYIGRTTCYEIGFCLSRRKPLYFLNAPADLPIMVTPDRIMDIDSFGAMAARGEEKPLEYPFPDDRTQRAIFNIWPELMPIKGKEVSRRLMICGSMQFYEKMSICQRDLQAMGIDVLIPKDEGALPDSIDEQSFLQFKRKVSSSYLKKIRDGATEAILVYNAPKRGIENYIGANTFVEIAMAFAWNRRIYIYNDYYEPYRDELLAWNCVCLNGDLSRIASDWNIQNQELMQEETMQLSLFDIGEVI